MTLQGIIYYCKKVVAAGCEVNNLRLQNGYKKVADAG